MRGLVAPLYICIDLRRVIATLYDVETGRSDVVNRDWIRGTARVKDEDPSTTSPAR